MAFGAFYHPDGLPLDPKSPHYPSTFLRSVFPIPCHSHNDQWRHTPLHAALGTGCISIEADIFASTDPDSKELYVAHDRNTLMPERTLEKMYIEPLITILETMNTPDAHAAKQLPQAMFQKDPAERPNGVFALSPTTSLILMLDFKSQAKDIIPVLLDTLTPLAQRSFLTRWDPASQSRMDGPITLVATGEADFDTILRAGRNSTPDDPLAVERFIFFDAPLGDLIRPGDPDSPVPGPINIDLSRPAKDSPTRDTLAKDKNITGPYRYTYNPSNSHTASMSFSRAVGAISPFLSSPDSLQRKVIRDQMKSGRDRGLITRYWGTPRWPRGLRDGVWEALEKEGVGLLSVDDLRGVRKGAWGGRAGGRWWGRRWRGEGRMGWVPEY